MLKLTKVISALSLIFLIAGLCLIILPLVSMTGVSANIGHENVNATNKGSFEVYDMTVHVSLILPAGQVIAYGSSQLVNLSPHSSEILPLTINPNSTQLVSPPGLNHIDTRISIAADLMKILPFSLSVVRAVNLSQGLAVLAVGQPSVLRMSNSSIETQTAISFFYGGPNPQLKGTFELNASNSTGTCGTFSVPVNVLEGQTVNLVAPVNISVSPRVLMTEPQNFTLSYFIVSNNLIYQLSNQSLILNPPVFNLTASGMQIKSVNGTYSYIALPMSFTDMQPAGFSMNINTTLYSGTQKVSANGQSIEAFPGKNSFVLNFLVPNGSHPTAVLLEINAFNSTFSQEVSLT